MCKKLQKIAVFLTKLLKYAYFERFYPKSWDIYGTYVARILCTKIALFLGISIQFVLENPDLWDIYTRWHPNALAQKLQKIELFLRKVAIYAYFRQFWPKSWEICGSSHVFWMCTKIAKNCKKLAFF